MLQAPPLPQELLSPTCTIIARGAISTRQIALLCAILSNRRRFLCKPVVPPGRWNLPIKWAICSGRRRSVPQSYSHPPGQPL